MYKRIVNPLKSNSFFLFGARGTGKTTLLRQLFSDALVMRIDLLDPSEEAAFSLHPNLLRERIHARTERPSQIVIDEVQKVPALLDVVHSLIETENLIFVLTGSSSRKLKSGGANLLAGRAFLYEIFPLSHLELGQDFDLSLALNWGTLPRLSNYKTNEERFEFLTAYAQVYLKEEVWGEQLVRNLLPFRKFLSVAAQQNGKVCHFTKIAKDVGADFNTIKKYFQILEDTLLGFFLEPYHESVRKRQKQSPKFYFFDGGVARALNETLDVLVKPRTSLYGECFENWVINEIYRLNRYFKTGYQLCTFLTQDGAEIDLILQKFGTPPLLIEIKSSNIIDPNSDLRHLEKLLPDFPPGSQALCLSQEIESRKIGAVLSMHWKTGLRYIFEEKIMTTEERFADKG